MDNAGDALKNLPDVREAGQVALAPQEYLQDLVPLEVVTAAHGEGKSANNLNSATTRSSRFESTSEPSMATPSVHKADNQFNPSHTPDETIQPVE
jgi:hypothetical protein